MAEIIKLSALRAIAGTWVTADNDSFVEFTVEPTAKGVVVTGRETIHGEGMVISDVSWDARGLHFTSTLPSNGYRAGHVFRLPAENGRLRHELTLVEIWVRRENVGKSDEETFPLDANSTIEPLLWMQRWYAGQCDGKWEDERGVRISTFDLPGWRLEIDLAGTEMEHVPFAKREYQPGDDLNSWTCEVADQKFKAECSADNLITVIGVFRSWVERSTAPAARDA
jgi:hypothetical protein